MPFSITRNKDTHQAHTIMGCEVMGREHPDFYAMRLVSNLLGGPAMSARLNVALREKAGLVYTVESILSVYPDRGVWQTYFGCDPKDTERCRHLVEREIQHLITTPLSPSQLHTAQKQFKGQLGISSSMQEQHAIAMAKSFALYGEATDLQEVFRHIDALTAADLQRVTREWIAPDKLSILTYKPTE